jgi:hypothetical protein
VILAPRLLGHPRSLLIMVQLDNSAPKHSYAAGVPTSIDLATRKASSIALIILLFTAATPFTPVSWLIQGEGGFLFDRLFAGIALFSACYFQWRIACLTLPLLVTSPVGGGTTVRNGRIERGGGDVLFIWRPDAYWPYAICEGLLLAVAEFGPSETIRRCVVSAVIAGLWFVGWTATPQSAKNWAWKQIKELWVWVLLWEILGVGSRGPAVGSRRRGHQVGRW